MKSRLFPTPLFVLFALLVLVGSTCVWAGKSEEICEPELRAMWVHRWEWPDVNPEKCKARIQQIMENLAEANFNVVVFQVRGQADVLYPSPYEPWSPIIGGKDPGFDPLAFAIEEAHQRGLELHAYVNPMPLWHRERPRREGQTPPGEPARSDPPHLYYSHGPGTEEPWIVHNEEGKPVDLGQRGGYYYLSPGIPEVQAYLRKVLLDLVQRYDVDGIHYDRIRYPGPKYSKDPTSVRRQAGPGNPNGLEWEDWQREQIDKLVNDLAAEIAEIKPWIRISGAVWGLYNRYAIEGYEKYSSGYHDYYQDSFRWARDGSMDTLMPMIYWDIPDPTPNYDEVLDYFAREVGADHLAGGILVRKDEIKDGETFDEIEYTRERGALGTILFSYNAVQEQHGWERIKKKIYPAPVAVPRMAWKDKPVTATFSGVVLDDERRPVVDAIVELSGGEPKWVSGSDGYFAFLQVEPGEKTLKITRPGQLADTFAGIHLRAGDVIRLVCLPLGGATAQVGFRPRAPVPSRETSSSHANLLTVTDPDNRVQVNGESAHVYRTGVFVADRLPLEIGMNKITSTIESERYQLIHTNWIKRTHPRPPRRSPALPLEIAEKSAQPKRAYWVQAGDMVPVWFEGSPGHQARFRIGRRGHWQPMAESEGLYTGRYIVQPEDRFEDATVLLELIRNKEIAGATPSKRIIKTQAEGTLRTLDPRIPLVARVTEPYTQLRYGLGEVRLGGPILTEATAGTILQLDGKIGNAYRVRLSETVQAWVGARQVELLPPGTPPARDFVTSFSVTNDEKYDFINLPYAQKYPYRLKALVDPPRLQIDLYGMTSNSTWITLRHDGQGVKRVDWEQVEPSLYRLTVDLNHDQFWGYGSVTRGNSLQVRIKRPPVLAAPPASPVSGLTIAVEAGHGGPRNTGAHGLSGSLEKNVNRATADYLIELLEQAGAAVVDCRREDETISLGDRVRRAIEGEADIFISIHANAAGSSGGYLRVAGTSTYYKHVPWKPLTEKIYERLIEIEGLEPWGVIGSFNYTPVRMTEMPSMLVEQAFMSHPGDEELLVDPARQRQMAEAIFKGLEDYLQMQRE